MKKTDIPVSGSDYTERIRESIRDIIECTNKFLKHIENSFVLKGAGNKCELSYCLYLMKIISLDLLKIYACVSNRYIEKKAIKNLVFLIRAYAKENSFRGIIYKDNIQNIKENAVKSFAGNRLHRLYNECRKAIDVCGVSSETIFDCHRITWNSGDVLVGSLRNREQLEVALKYNFYHIPSYLIPDDKLCSISYVAIYQSKNFFGSDAGIYYFGKVLSVDKKIRSDITQIPSSSKESYYLFNIGGWHKLDSPIRADRGGALFNFTNIYKLIRAETVDELSILTESDFKLYSSIKVSLQKGYDKVATMYKRGTIAIDGGRIIVYVNKICVYNLPVSDYIKNPVKYFGIILGFCK